MSTDSTPQVPIAAIILAAGTSSRMGAHKLLLQLGDRPIITHALDAVLASTAQQKVVVLGRDADTVRTSFPQQGVTAVVNPDYSSGMASSMITGLDALSDTPLGALFLLADQPLVTPELTDAVLAEARAHPNAIVAASFAGQRGHPVYFPRRLFEELRGIRGDEGGRRVIARHQDVLRLIDWPNLMAGLDVDTAEEYARLQAYWMAQSNGAER